MRKKFKKRKKKEKKKYIYFFVCFKNMKIWTELPVGKHIYLRYFDENKEEIKRSYTPITTNDTLGHFDLMIKIYEKGKMTQYLDSLKVGATVEIRGPAGFNCHTMYLCVCVCV